MRRPKVSLNQTGWFETPRVDQLPVSVANDAEPAAPRVRLIEQHPEIVHVKEEQGNSRPFIVSIDRENSAAMFSLSFTYDQFRQIILQGSRLLGTVALDLDDLDDCFPETEEDLDNEE